jgi:hypothetical protein
MMDILMIGAAVLFVALTWGLLRLCEALEEHDSGERQ